MRNKVMKIAASVGLIVALVFGGATAASAGARVSLNPDGSMATVTQCGPKYTGTLKSGIKIFFGLRCTLSPTPSTAKQVVVKKPVTAKVVTAKAIVRK